jgi:hypothetical protein
LEKEDELNYDNNWLRTRYTGMARRKTWGDNSV